MPAADGVAWVLTFAPITGPGTEDLSWSTTGTVWHRARLPAITT